MEVEFKNIADQHCLQVGDEKYIIDTVEDLVKIKDNIIRYLDEVYIE